MTLVPVQTGVQSDQATTINTALADPAITVAELPAGTIWIDHPVEVPSGKTLIGVGRDLTIIKALSGFDPTTEAGRNGIVSSAADAVEVNVVDLTADASGITVPSSGGDIRLNGIFMRRAVDFIVERVGVMNASGYGQFAQGDPNGWTVFASGMFRGCHVDNAGIAFEQMACDGVTLEHCHARDGSQSVNQSSYFHPLSGSKNIIYRHCSAYGRASVGVDIMANLGRDMENIRIEDCDFELTGAVPALITQQTGKVIGLWLARSRFKSAGGMGVDMSQVRGAAYDCKIDGSPIGAQFRGGTTFDLGRSSVIGRTPPPYPTAASYGVAVWPDSRVRAFGGEIKALGTGPKYPVSSYISVSSDTVVATS